MVGPASLDVNLSAPYAKCNPAAISTGGSPLPCDGGATASDANDGNLTAGVTVCGTSQLFSASGLAACMLDTSKPGTYSVTFTAVNSLGLSATVTRTVRVLAVCLAGQYRCTLGDCTTGGSYVLGF